MTRRRYSSHGFLFVSPGCRWEAKSWISISLSSLKISPHTMDDHYYCILPRSSILYLYLLCICGSSFYDEVGFPANFAEAAGRERSFTLFKAHRLFGWYIGVAVARLLKLKALLTRIIYFLSFFFVITWNIH